jgi:hypothetical protein
MRRCCPRDCAVPDLLAVTQVSYIAAPDNGIEIVWVKALTHEQAAFLAIVGSSPAFLISAN